MSKALQGLALLLLFAAIPTLAVVSLRSCAPEKRLSERSALPTPATERGAATSVGSPQPTTSVATAPQVTSSAVTSAAASGDAPAALTEADLMAKLRQLADSDPVESLRLAADGNTRFADSPDAPERAWRSVKSLVNLKRFHEARAEAENMVARYPGTSWSLDVQRHLLVYPLDQPSREEQQQRLRDSQE